MKLNYKWNDKYKRGRCVAVNIIYSHRPTSQMVTHSAYFAVVFCFVLFCFVFCFFCFVLFFCLFVCLFYFSKANVDVIVVYMHWGKELSLQPRPYQLHITKHLVSLGVQVLIGSHPHVLQPHCVHGNKLIAYSLGNFMFPPSRTPGGNDPVMCTAKGCVRLDLFANKQKSSSGIFLSKTNLKKKKI